MVPASCSSGPMRAISVNGRRTGRVRAGDCPPRCHELDARGDGGFQGADPAKYEDEGNPILPLRDSGTTASSIRSRRVIARPGLRGYAKRTIPRQPRFGLSGCKADVRKDFDRQSRRDRRRIIRTADRLGIASVAVYSEADAPCLSCARPTRLIASARRWLAKAI